MRRTLLAAGFCLAALIPSFAMAQSCEQQRNGQAASAFEGAGAGALAGEAIAGHNNRGAGAVIGAIGGAIVGNQLTRPDAA